MCLIAFLQDFYDLPEKHLYKILSLNYLNVHTDDMPCEESWRTLCIDMAARTSMHFGVHTTTNNQKALQYTHFLHRPIEM